MLTSRSGLVIGIVVTAAVFCVGMFLWATASHNRAQELSSELFVAERTLGIRTEAQRDRANPRIILYKGERLVSLSPLPNGNLRLETRREVDRVLGFVQSDELVIREIALGDVTDANAFDAGRCYRRVLEVVVVESDTRRPTVEQTHLAQYAGNGF